MPKLKEMFDVEEMNKLYNLEFEQASKGYPWKKPPKLEEYK